MAATADGGAMGTARGWSTPPSAADADGYDRGSSLSGAVAPPTHRRKDAHNAHTRLSRAKVNDRFAALAALLPTLAVASPSSIVVPPPTSPRGEGQAEETAHGSGGGWIAGGGFPLQGDDGGGWGGGPARAGSSSGNGGDRGGGGGGGGVADDGGCGGGGGGGVGDEGGVASAAAVAAGLTASAPRHKAELLDRTLWALRALSARAAALEAEVALSSRRGLGRWVDAVVRGRSAASAAVAGGWPVETTTVAGADWRAAVGKSTGRGAPHRGGNPASPRAAGGGHPPTLRELLSALMGLFLVREGGWTHAEAWVVAPAPASAAAPNAATDTAMTAAGSSPSLSSQSVVLVHGVSLPSPTIPPGSPLSSRLATWSAAASALVFPPPTDRVGRVYTALRPEWLPHLGAAPANAFSRGGPAAMAAGLSTALALPVAVRGGGYSGSGVLRYAPAAA
ncbi:hypothetical protein MMPV_002668 [Pyropia vietnamensis]